MFVVLLRNASPFFVPPTAQDKFLLYETVKADLILSYRVKKRRSVRCLWCLLLTQKVSFGVIFALGTREYLASLFDALGLHVRLTDMRHKLRTVRFWK